MTPWLTACPTDEQHEALRRVGGRWLVTAWGYPRWAVQVVDHADDASFTPDGWVALNPVGVPIAPPQSCPDAAPAVPSTHGP